MHNAPTTSSKGGAEEFSNFSLGPQSATRKLYNVDQVIVVASFFFVYVNKVEGLSQRKRGGMEGGEREGRKEGGGEKDYFYRLQKQTNKIEQ